MPQLFHAAEGGVVSRCVLSEVVSGRTDIYKGGGEFGFLNWRAQTSQLLPTWRATAPDGPQAGRLSSPSKHEAFLRPSERQQSDRTPPEGPHRARSSLSALRGWQPAASPSDSPAAPGSAGDPAH